MGIQDISLRALFTPRKDAHTQDSSSPSLWEAPLTRPTLAAGSSLGVWMLPSLPWVDVLVHLLEATENSPRAKSPGWCRTTRR